MGGDVDGAANREFLAAIRVRNADSPPDEISPAIFQNFREISENQFITIVGAF